MSERSYISLELSYPLDHFPSLDSKIEKCIGWSKDASGAGDGVRDMAFTFHDTEIAIDFGTMLKKKFPQLTRIHVQEWKNDNWHDIKTIKGKS